MTKRLTRPIMAIVISLCLLLAAAVLCFAMPTTASAEDTTPSTELYWGLDEEGVLTLSSDATNPATPNLYSTIKVSNSDRPNWYNDRAKITSVTVDTYACAPASMVYWFNDCTSLISVDLTGLDTSKATNMSSMFFGCQNLTLLNVSSLDTSGVTDMGQMFAACSSLTSLDLSSFVTSEVTFMYFMFYDCNSLTSLDLSNFVTSSLTNMSNMFYDCSGLTSLDLSNFDTSSVTNMGGMFSGCSSLTSLDLSAFDTSSVTNMGGMFSRTSKLDTIKVSDSLAQELSKNNSADLYVASHATWYDAGGNAYTYDARFNQGGTYTTYTHNLTHVEIIDKTCTTDGVLAHDHCLECGKDFIDGVEKTADELKIPASHTWGSEAVLVEPTCTTDGSITGTCTVCGTIADGEVLPKLGHDYGEWAVVKQATFTEYGEEQRVCSRDGTHIETRRIEKLTPLLYWGLNEEGVLTLSSNDTNSATPNTPNLYNTTNIGGYNRPIWYNDRDKITSVNVDTCAYAPKSVAWWFADCSNLTSVDLTGLDTSKVTNMDSMFRDCSGLTSLNLSSFDTSKVTTMNAMFSGCSSLTSLDLSKFNTSVVTEMQAMFLDTNKLDTIKVSDSLAQKLHDTTDETFLYYPYTHPTWCDEDGIVYTETVKFDQGGTYTLHIFTHVDIQDPTCTTDGVLAHDHCSVCNRDFIDGVRKSENDLKIEATGHTVVKDDAVEPTCTEKGKTEGAHCSVCNEVITAQFEVAALGHDYGEWTVVKQASGTEEGEEQRVCSRDGTHIETRQTEKLMYWGLDEDGVLTLGSDGANPATPNLYSRNIYPNWDNNAHKITSVKVDTYACAPASVESWFYGYSKLQSVDLTGLDTSNVTNMSYMFYDCSSLTSLDISSLDTSNVTNMSHMFYNCKSLAALDLSTFDTSKVTNMHSMFDYCRGLTSLDLSSFDTSNVKGMSAMFYECGSLTSLNLSSFDTSNVGDMSAMFYGCYSLTSLDLSSFDTSKVLYMGSMFYGCSRLTSLDLTKFNIFSAEMGMRVMFFGTNNLHTIKVSDSLAQKLSTTNDTELFSTQHETWYDANGIAYTDSKKFDQGGTYMSHRLAHVEIQNQTCTTDGVLAHDHCSVCDKDFIDGALKSAAELKIAAGHSFGEWIDEIPATATENGTKGHKDCSVCDKHFDTEGNELTELAIPAKGITVTVTGGAIDGATGNSVIVNANGEVTVIAANVEGKAFVGWSADGGATILSTDARYTFTATENLNLVAVYKVNAPAAEQNGGLSGGAIAGITIGVVLVVLIAAYIACYFVLYSKGKLLKGKAWNVIYKPMTAIFNKKENG